MVAHLFSKNANNIRLSSGGEKDKFNKALWDASTPLYIGYGNSEHARYGSIGVAVPHGKKPDDRANWGPRPADPPVPTHSRTWYSYSHYPKWDAFDIYWDKKHIANNAQESLYSTELFWLTKHTGETKWVFEKKPKVEKPKVIALDKLGNEVQVGDFVTFVARSTYGKGKGDLMFGFVQTISNAGIMMCKNIKLSDEDYQREWRVAKGDQVSKLNKEILNQLMMRRLTF